MTTPTAGRWIAEIKTELHNARTLRATLVALAYVAAENPSQHILGILTASRIGEELMNGELERFRSILDGDLANRIHVVKQTGQGAFSAVPCGLTSALISGMVRDKQLRGREPAERPRATRHDVLPVLLMNWMTGNTPMTVRRVCDATGLSYPTVASVLQALRADSVVGPESHTRVSLSRFPAVHWKQWVALRAATRGVYRFANRSVDWRSTTDLFGRVQELGLPDVAVSGALGARRRFPDLDLSGHSSLDLIAHGAAASELGFIEAIDKRLERVADGTEPAHLVVRTLPRTCSYFERDASGVWHADPFECMADLHEARLHIQADRMLDAILATRQEFRPGDVLVS